MDFGQALVLIAAIYGTIYYLYNINKQDKESGFITKTPKK